MKARHHQHFTLLLILLFLLTSLPPNFHSQQIKENTTNFQANEEKITQIMDLITLDLLEEYLSTLVGFAPRATGTYGCQQTADYLKTQFQTNGLEVWVQDYTAFGNRWHPRLYKGQNVEGTIRGTQPESESCIIFNAHYDTVEETWGANDDGSGTAAVLAAAYALSQYEFKHDIKLVGFSGEEFGLLGSQAYAKTIHHQSKDIVVELNADMIGKATSAETGRQMGLSMTEDSTWVPEIFTWVNQTQNMGFSFGLGTTDRDGRGWSDYFSFCEYGYETVSIWQSEGDEYMHSWGDDLTNVNMSYLLNMTRLIAGTLAVLADMEEFPTQIRIRSPSYGGVYFENRLLKQKDCFKALIIDDIWVWAEAIHGEENIDYVEFYRDNRLLGIDEEAPYKYEMERFLIGNHRITVKAYDEEGQLLSTDFHDAFFFNLIRN